MEKLLNKLHFGHTLMASGLVTGTASVATMLGHLDGYDLFRIVGSVIGLLVLSILLARFE